MAHRCDKCGTENVDEARFCARCGAPQLPPRDRDPLIGNVIAGRFRVVSVIGEGGMGRVYRGEQQMSTTARAVAIKVLTTNPNDAKAIARFERECAVVVSLTHPNTIRFYDFGSLPDGRLYIAMEYVEGRSLAQAITENGALPQAVVDRLVIEIGGALAEAHRRGIVHRDLKPDNVLLAHHGDEGEHAKVLDFGIAKNAHEARGEITAAGTIVGTPAYMSPEQLSGNAVDERSDVYALGLMTYEMLTGSRPFAGCSTALEWATAHLTKTPMPFESFPATRVLSVERRAAILHALEKDPDKRTPTALRFVEELTGTIRTSLPAGAPGEIPTTKDRDVKTVQARTPRAAVRSSEELKLPLSRTRYVLYAIGALAMTAIGAFVTSTFVGGSSGGSTTAPSDAGVLDAPSDAGPRIAWLHVLTSSASADSEDLALGAPDGQCAVLRPDGNVTLELTPEMPTVTNGTPDPDLQIVVRDARSVYRVDVGLDHRNAAMHVIASEVVGTTALDVDETGVHEIRFVRVKNPSRTQTVCVDAVGVYVDRDDAGS
jgi:serine/threonine-protein kinase